MLGALYNSVMSKFVIYTPDHKDYLTAFSEKPTGWNGELHQAHLFRTFEQAEQAAKKLVAKMSEHSAPYSISIREINVNNGQWKVEGEIEVQPQPDRAEYYHRHPELRGRVGAPPPSKPDICPVKYVIYQPAKNDYLGTIKESGSLEETGWSPRPEDAIGYATFAEAERKAGELVGSKNYELTVCELHETEDQYWTKPLKDLFPVDASLN